MGYLKAISELNAIDHYPIRIDEIANSVRRNSFFDEIELHAVDESVEFYGSFVRYRVGGVPYQERTDVGKVIFNQNLDQRMQRIVVAKELFHAFSRDQYLIKTQDALNDLLPAVTDRGSVPVDAMSHGALEDVFGTFFAMPFLIPRRHLQVAIDLCMNAEQVAERFEVPATYADHWMAIGIATLDKIDRNYRI